jgi:hypothetical protein
MTGSSVPGVTEEGVMEGGGGVGAVVYVCMVSGSFVYEGMVVIGTSVDVAVAGMRVGRGLDGRTCDADEDVEEGLEKTCGSSKGVSEEVGVRVDVGA